MNQHEQIPLEQYSQQKKAKILKPPKTFTARELSEIDFPPMNYIIPTIIPEGLTLFAGAPKLGKSWMVLEIAIAVAFGGYCLGNIDCEKAEVLYLALEDNERRLQSRIKTLWRDEADYDLLVPDGLHLALEWPRANEGGIDAIRDWLKNHPDARLVIIDVLAMFRSLATGKEQNPYAADYQAIKGLQQLAGEFGVAIVVVHHTRKGNGDIDPFEAISGTLGLSGAADTGLVLSRDQNGVTLYGRGRDIEEIEMAVTFDRLTCKWLSLGNAGEVRSTEERKVILDVLLDNQEAMTPAEIAGALGQPSNNIKQLLFKMSKAGEVIKAKRGYYSHPQNAGYSQSGVSPDNFDNRDNLEDEKPS